MHALLIQISLYSSWDDRLLSGVGSNHVLRGPQIQVVGVALIIEFCDHNIPSLKVILCSNLVKTCAKKV